MAQSFRSKSYEVRESGIHGRGAYTVIPVTRGELLAVRAGSVVGYEEARRRDANYGGFSMQIEPGLFLCPDSAEDTEDVAVFFNHSCDPNVGIRNQISFVALRDIEPGEELTFDYATNVSFPFRFECGCGSDFCRGVITGDDWRIESLQVKYSGYFDAAISQYLGQAPASNGYASVPGSVPTDGTVFERIVRSLTGFAAFDAWRDGIISRAEYDRRLDEILSLPDTVPLNENERALSSRLWWNASECVDSALSALMEKGAIEHVSYDWARFVDIARRIQSLWMHRGYSTYIFPEESQLLFAIAALRQPQRVAVVGSYYGYWAAFAIAGSLPSAPSVTLLDSNADVCSVAADNLGRLGLNGDVEVRALDAFDFFASDCDEFDMVILDAEGPKMSGAPGLRGKRIYGPLLESIVPHLADAGSCLVAHNVLVDCVSRHPYFETLMRRNRDDLTSFLDTAERAFPNSLHVDSTEGVGIYWR